MLGVLAIIGVLSIGGIAGYTLAMNRYRANEILDTASKIAVIAMSKDGGRGGDANLTDLGVSAPAGTSGISANADGYVTITYTDANGKVKELVDDLINADTSTAQKLK